MFRDGCGNLHKGAFKNNRGFARERIEGKAWLHRQTGPEKRVNLKLILYYNMLSG